MPFPEEKQRPAQTPESARTIIALDPGECIFQSAYSVDHTVAYGNKAMEDEKKARLEAARSAAVAAYNAARMEGTPTETHLNRAKRFKAKLRWCPGNGGANRLWALSEKIDNLVLARKVQRRVSQARRGAISHRRSSACAASCATSSTTRTRRSRSTSRSTTTPSSSPASPCGRWGCASAMTARGAAFARRRRAP